MKAFGKTPIKYGFPGYKSWYLYTFYKFFQLLAEGYKFNSVSSRQILICNFVGHLIFMQFCDSNRLQRN